MRIYSHWTRIERTVEIGGLPQTVKVYGGSDHSAAEAMVDAEGRLARLLEGIRSHRRRDEGYEADIREEIVARIDDKNIVTRNRYGAEVLNSANVTFVDIDRPPLTFREVIFGWDRNASRCKERILDSVRKQASTPTFRGLGMRLYETHKGVRAIVSGEHDPQAKSTRALMRKLGADGLYVTLCAKQGCFRARLTPKPYRMHCRTHRVVFPRPDEISDREFRLWLSEYESKSREFATCRYLETVGPVFRDTVIDYHDSATGALSTRPLA